MFMQATLIKFNESHTETDTVGGGLFEEGIQCEIINGE